MDGQKATSVLLRQRFIRLMMILACATLSSAVVGAVKIGPSGESSAQPAPAVVREVEPVPMISTDELGEAVTAAYVIEADRPAEPANAPPEPASAELLHEVPPAPPPAPTVDVAPPEPAVRKMLMEVTAYCACKRCCGPNAQGITASGKYVSYNNGHFVAADTSLLPFGTRLQIPGYADDAAVEVIDRGGAIKGNKLDVYFPTHHEARIWGRRWIEVTILD